MRICETPVRKFRGNKELCAIVGAAYLQGMRKHLRDIPCGFMMPKSTLNKPHLSSRLENQRDEL